MLVILGSPLAPRNRMLDTQHLWLWWVDQTQHMSEKSSSTTFDRTRVLEKHLGLASGIADVGVCGDVAPETA